MKKIKSWIQYTVEVFQVHFDLRHFDHLVIQQSSGQSNIFKIIIPQQMP